DERCGRLSVFDTNTRPWINAIVPWDRTDRQCQSEEGKELTAKLERTLPLILDRGRRTDCRIAVNGVPTLTAFTEVLPKVVAHATKQFFKPATPHPVAGPHVPRPRLTGPTPSTLPPARDTTMEEKHDGGS